MKDQKNNMIEHYEIETIEQLRAIADVLRLRILDALIPQPMTVTQLGDVLGMAPAKVHYHVRELERVGLLRLVETREKGGILEKYYQPIARYIGVEQSLLSAPANEAQALVSALLGQVHNNFLRAFRQGLEKRSEKPDLMLGLGISRLFITRDELKDLDKRIQELFKPYETERHIEGEQEIFTMMLTYPENESMAQVAAAAATSTSPLSLVEGDADRVVGTARYSRADLEKALAEGKRLTITVVGVCQFADD
ncbi:MAG TPA: helix-turn-helix domain-containing protein, partial [Chthonomonadales bacterium]|nr:helix-turn-helix domain-containing protein [Chthonomonadales bacterium]